MIRVLQLLLVIGTLGGCALDITSPQSDLEGLPAGLDVQFTIDPEEVSQHGAFSARLIVTNTTETTIRVTTAHGCLAVPHVIRNGKRVPLRGSWWGCTAAITTHSFAPGETWSQTWDMRAELYAQHPGDADGAPAPKGMYLIQAEFDTYSDAGPLRKPMVGRTLRVR